MLPQELHTFWNYREDLSMENRLITKEPDFSYLPHLGRRYWNRYMMDIWVLKNVCSKQGTLYSGQAFPMISVRLWKNVEFVRQVPEQPNHWKCE